MLALLHLLALCQTSDASVAEPVLLDASVVLRYSATRAEPQTWFSLTADDTLDTAALLQPRPLHHFGSLVAFLGAEVELSPVVAVRALLDSGELRTGDSLEPPLDQTLTTDGEPLASGLFTLARIKELAALFSWRHGSVEVGRRLALVGESLVFEDFATGVAARVDLEDPGWTLDAGAYVVGHDLEALREPNALVHLRVGHDLSLFESIGLFGAVLVENGLLEDTLTSALSEALVVTGNQERLIELFLADRSSSGFLAYAGADLQLLPADGWSVRAAAAGAFGQVDIELPAYGFDLRSWAATAEATYGLTSQIGVGAFLVAMSGDQAPTPRVGQRAEYRGFIAVAPYWAWTGLFFSGGLTQGLYPGQASAAGVNGHGVMVGGVRADLSADGLWTEARVAGLWALAGPPAAPLGGTGNTYGLEADLVVEWQPTDGLGVGIEVDVMRSGSFFPEQDIAVRVIGQVHARAGN